MAEKTGAMLRPRFEGLRGFYLLWAGQFVSIFASNMTGFAITLWAWDLTGSATALVLVGFTSFIPRAVLSPVAGALVDRWNRKLIMMLSDFAAALSTAFLLAMFLTDAIQIWHLYAAALFSGIFGSFQYPAYSAVITTMVPKQYYNRANSMRSIIQSASGVGAPLLAGALIGVLQISGIMIIDLVTFFIAIGTLIFIVIPPPQTTAAGEEGKGTIWQETAFGFKYVWARPSLLGMFLLFTVTNIATGFGYPMQTPMVLAKTGNDAAILGIVRAVGSAGFLTGGLLMTVWPGPKRKMDGINLSFILWGLLGTFIFGVGWTLNWWVVGAFFMAVFNPIINANFMTILQSKVAPDVQGRIFGMDMLLTTITFPFAQLLAGVAVDNWLEPAMAGDGALAHLFGGLVGTGAGAGIGLMILIAGLVSIFTGLAGFAIPVVRDIEKLMPDHEGTEEG